VGDEKSRGRKDVELFSTLIRAACIDLRGPVESPTRETSEAGFL
jgi:hypothetical protein